MSTLGAEFLRDVLHLVFALYAGIVMGHFVLQVIYADRTHRAARRERAARLPARRLPSVDIVVASYNEDPAGLEACFESLLRQDYEGEIHVYVVDDCSTNSEDLLPVYARYAELPGWTVVLAHYNRGKREAQNVAYGLSKGEIMVTIDSDTEVDPDGVSEIVRGFDDVRVGAITGDVGVTNAKTNILTRLIGMRYWVAFNQERAAQSYFRTVLCCSGPLAAYRRTVLDRIWHRYVSQSYRDVACTYGDDRHLTNLVLDVGFDTRFLPSAHAITNAPEKLGAYLRQQLRWNKSFYRELLWTLPFLLTRSPYIVFEVIVQTALPLLLTLAIAAALVFSAIDHPARLVHYVEMIVVMAALRCSYAIYRTRKLSFLLFILYGFVHVVLLIPTRIKALFTLEDNRWGTRTAV
jgi:hyaluronan synthase/N-acetylglucosaminyltransferase